MNAAASLCPPRFYPARGGNNTLGRYPEMGIAKARSEAAATLPRLWNGETVAPPRNCRTFPGALTLRHHQRSAPRSIMPCSGLSSLAASYRVPSRLTLAYADTSQRAPMRHDRAPSPTSPSPV